jgi:hypothetical protein
MMDRPARWRRDIEAAYYRLSKLEQRRARGTMFDYYYMIHDKELAIQFCDITRLTESHQLMCAMDLYLEKNDLDQARLIARRCSRLCDVDNPFERSAALEALACYFARIGEWDDALTARIVAPRDQAVSRQAAVGHVAVFVAKALAAAQHELETVAKLRHSVDPVLSVSLPGIENELLDATERDIRRLKRGLERLLGDAGRKAFGL